MEMGSKRNFVLHRNDLGVPSDRKIEVIETGSKKTDGYPSMSDRQKLSTRIVDWALEEA